MKWLPKVRAIAMVEGISYVLLLFVAMPLKYYAGLPIVVRVVGAIHGVLFVALALAVLNAWLSKQLSFRNSVIVAIASLIPFGTFAIDSWLKRLYQNESAPVST